MARFDSHSFDSKSISIAPKRFGQIALGVATLILLTSCFTTIGAGERGVVFSQLGGVQDRILDEGFQFKIPFLETVIPIDVKIQKSETQASASSRDLQVVTSVIALNYHVDPSAVNDVYQSVGLAYENRIIDPAVQESVKAVTARFTAEDLITQRDQVSTQIKELLATRLGARNIIVDEFSITELNFSEIFNNSIEAKQVAEQQALKARQDLERIKIEAEQKVTTSRAEADAQRLQRETITKELLQLRAIEKWDGRLPQVTSGSVPLLNLESLSR
ncbi:MAG: prohibitin family protein [Acidobacteria bacterium]|nr:prohibitin family protein [Acidobacteriota bacterium]